jgi:hypothetical protein
MEYYDFALYRLASALIDSQLFVAPETQGRDLVQVEDALDDVRAGVRVSR